MEKGSAESQAEEYSAVSQPKPESIGTEKLTGCGQCSVDSEIKITNSVSEKRVKTDLSRAFSLFNKYFRESGSVRTVVGTGEKLSHGDCDIFEDIEGSIPANDKNTSKALNLFPQRVCFDSLPPEQKPFAPASVQPWLFRGAMPANSPGFRSFAETSPTMKPPSAQLTIFYAGMVNVYDDVSADKAQDIMMLADSGNPKRIGLIKPASAAQRTPCASLLSSMARASFSLQTSGQNKGGSIPGLPLSGVPVHKLQSDLPIARKHSIQRFLEKRKDRVSKRGPYINMDSDAPSSLTSGMQG